ncbi:hypothetical protein N9023_07380 [Opitutaceae bacterium]|nr:hypothetical protein [Opitutaceae bacterium]
MITSTLPRSAFRGLTIIAAFAWAGCQSTPAKIDAPSPDHIRVGMTISVLEEILRDPTIVDPATEYNRMEETRLYVVEHPAEYRPITTGMRDVPYVDPITGVMRMVQEPIAAEQRIVREEKITVVIRHNQVISVDRRISENSSFSR